MIYGLAIFLLWTVSFFFAGIEAGLLGLARVAPRAGARGRGPSG
jgi:Mg2+/Co2+ transporter CorB